MLASDDKNSVLCEAGPGLVNDFAYSAYGHRSDEHPASTHLGYNGELREAQTGCYLLGKGYRAFSPSLMRFNSPDSWSPFGAGGLNAYMYVLGNPIKWKDDTGHMVNPAKAVSWIKQAKLDAAAELARPVSKGASNSAEAVLTTASEASTKQIKHADSAAKSVRFSTPTTPANDVIEGAAQVRPVPNGPRAGSTQSWVRHSDFKGSATYMGSEGARPVSGSGYINQSAGGQMALPGPPIPAPRYARAQAKPVPRSVATSNPNQARIDELKGKIKAMKNQRHDYNINYDKIDKWNAELAQLKVRR